MVLSVTHRKEQERKLEAIFDTAIANHQKYFVQWSAEQLSILTAFGEFLVGCIVDYWLLGGHHVHNRILISHPLLPLEYKSLFQNGLVNIEDFM